MNNIAKNINSLLSVDPVSGIYILQEWNRFWRTIYINYIHRLLHGRPVHFFLHHSVHWLKMVKWSEFLADMLLAVYVADFLFYISSLCIVDVFTADESWCWSYQTAVPRHISKLFWCRIYEVH